MTAPGILVVGGYGAVGAAATRQLAEWFPGRVHAAGRDLGRARELAARSGTPSAPVRAARVDVTDAAGFEHLLEERRIGAVLLCVEPPDAAIAAACLSRGVHLVDVGASHALLAQVEALPVEPSRAGRAAATAVLSVGVAPGLTNLLARRAHDLVGGADRVDISVLLGAGERHGRDAVRWTVAGLAGATGQPPARPRRVALPGFGTRTVHPFPFSDQHTLRRTLRRPEGGPDVTTRLCLDSRPLTAALFGLRGAGAFRAARHPRGERFVAAALGHAHLGGGDGFAVRVDAYRTDVVHGQRHAAFALTGRGQGRVTGLVAARVTRSVLAGGVPSGIHHIDQVAELAALPDDLAASGITLWTPAGYRGGVSSSG